MQNPAVVSGLQPNSGPLSGATEVTVLGTNFFNGPGLACQFKGTVEREVKAVWKSSTWIMCVTPPVASRLEVKVEITNNGQDFTSSGVIYTFQTAALALGLQPSTGPVQGRIRITVAGAHFAHAPQLTCRFAQAAAPALTLINSTAIVCGVPTSSTATCVEVSISNNGVDFSGNLLQFCYIGRFNTACKVAPDVQASFLIRMCFDPRCHGSYTNPAFLRTAKWFHEGHGTWLRLHRHRFRSNRSLFLLLWGQDRRDTQDSSKHPVRLKIIVQHTCSSYTMAFSCGRRRR